MPHHQSSISCSTCRKTQQLNQFFKSFLLLAILLLMASPLLAADNKMKTLSFCYAGMEPYYIEDNNTIIGGITVDIIESVLSEEMGYTITYQRLPWVRCQLLVKSGEIDLFITLPNDKRAKYSIASKEAVLNEQFVLFANKSNPRLDEIKKIEDIADIKKGGFSVITYTGSGWHKKNIEQAGIIMFETPQPQAAWSMLAAQRGDLMIDMAGFAYPLMEKAGVTDQVIGMGTVLDETNFHLLMSKKSAHVGIMSEFDEKLMKLKKDGRYEKLLVPPYGK